MRSRQLRFACVVSLVLVAPACGDGDDDGDGDAAAPVTEPPPTAPAQDDDQGVDDTPVSGTDGTVQLDVNSVTFDAPASRCNVSDSTIALTAAGELSGQPVEVIVDGSGTGGAWIIQAQVVDSSGAVVYQSANTSDAEVTGSAVTMSGEWVWNDADGDLTGGDGTLTATCS